MYINIFRKLILIFYINRKFQTRTISAASIFKSFKKILTKHKNRYLFSNRIKNSLPKSPTFGTTHRIIVYFLIFYYNYYYRLKKLIQNIREKMNSHRISQKLRMYLFSPIICVLFSLSPKAISKQFPPWSFLPSFFCFSYCSSVAAILCLSLLCLPLHF